MKLKISKIVAVYDKSSKGVAYVTKTGKPYKKATLKFVETGEKLVGANQWDGELFKEGQVLDGEIAEREYNGKKYFDLKVTSKKEREATEITALKFAVAKHDFLIKQMVEWIKSHATPSHPMPNFDTDSQGKPVGKHTEPIDDEINPEDIPF